MAVLSFFFICLRLLYPVLLWITSAAVFRSGGCFLCVKFLFFSTPGSSLSCCSRAAVCNSCQEPLSVTPARSRCDRKPGRMSLSVRKGATRRKAGALTTGGSYRPWNVSDGFYRLNLVSRAKSLRSAAGTSRVADKPRRDFVPYRGFLPRVRCVRYVFANVCWKGAQK